jgi:hypothetical protein
MFRFLAALLIATTTACVHHGDAPVVRVGSGADVDNVRAREAGRAAGAGGSHAPGSTGLGAGTMGVENAARVGSAR